MPLDPEIEKSLLLQEQAIRDMLKGEKIDSNLYCKLIVCLAYEYSDRGEYQRAMELVVALPAEYFTEVQRGQMEADPNYSYLSYTLALTLFQQGLVYLGPKIIPTMPLARA